MNAMLSHKEIKQQVGRESVTLVKDGMTLGIGTGTTAHWFTLALAERMQSGLQCRAVPTSQPTAALAAQLGIPLVTLNDVDSIDLTIDGADEISPELYLIKGGGGALLQEKMVAAASKQVVIIADHTKLVTQLGAFPLPIEVIPFGWKQVQKRVMEIGCKEITMRLQENGQPFITDHGHFILDCHFHAIAHPLDLNMTLHNVPGVVETGIFTGLATGTMIGYPDGRIERKGL